MTRPARGAPRANASAEDRSGQTSVGEPRARRDFLLRGAVLASALESRTYLVLERYQAALRRVDSPLVADPVTREQAMQQAREVMREVAGYLRGLRPIFEQRRMELSQQVGMARAAGNVHPAQSLRAAAILFETILTTVTEVVAPTDALTMLPAIAVAINNSVLYRIREGATAYASFLLDQIQGANLSERRRIAREIHDRVGHAAALAQRSLELHGLYLPSRPEDAQHSLAEASAALRETVDAIRAVTTDLHLSEPLGGLAEALLSYAEAVTDTTIRIDVNGDESWAPENVLEEVFLVIREALRNAVRHGPARRADVNIDIAPHELRATVDDDGVGFRPDLLSESAAVGLASMRERMELLGGSLSVSSEVGWGTHVEMRVPLSGRRDDL